jgi:hypothetical protein
MTIGPAPMIRMEFMSVRLGIQSPAFKAAQDNKHIAPYTASLRLVMDA